MATRLVCPALCASDVNSPMTTSGSDDCWRQVAHTLAGERRVKVRCLCVADARASTSAPPTNGPRWPNARGCHSAPCNRLGSTLFRHSFLVMRYVPSKTQRSITRVSIVGRSPAFCHSCGSDGTPTKDTCNRSERPENLIAHIGGAAYMRMRMGWLSLRTMPDGLTCPHQ